MAPIYLPDGSEVSEIVLPDGTSASEVIGPDGNVLFEDPLYMFDSPIYRFWAAAYSGADGDSPVGFPETFAGLSTTAVNSPTFNADFNGLSTIEYDSGTTDHHTWTADSQLPTGSSTQVSIIALFYTTDASNSQWISGYGGLGVGLRGGFQEYATFENGSLSQTAGTYPTGSLTSMMLTNDKPNSESKLFIDGSNTAAATSSASASPTDSNHSHGYDLNSSNKPMAGGIAEIIYADTIETGDAYASWHTKRVG